MIEIQQQTPGQIRAARDSLVGGAGAEGGRSLRLLSLTRLSWQVAPPSGSSRNWLELLVTQAAKSELCQALDAYNHPFIARATLIQRGQPHTSYRPSVSPFMSGFHDSSQFPEDYKSTIKLHFAPRLCILLSSKSVLILSCFHLWWEKPPPPFLFQLHFLWLWVPLNI